MILIKASLAWVLIMAAFGWGILRLMAPQNASWTPLILVIVAFIVLVGATGCRIPKSDH